MKKTPLVGLLIMPIILLSTSCQSTSVDSTYGSPSDYDGYYAGTDIYDPNCEGVDLQTELHDLMIETHHTYTKYTDCSPAFMGGADLNEDGTKMEFYWSGTLVSFGSGYYDENGTRYELNREHVWPKSLSNGLFKEVDFSANNDMGAGTDLYHIRPTVAETNSAHSNYPYGIVDKEKYPDSQVTEGLLETPAGWVADRIFEPKDEYKGDTARIVLYVYMHYSNAYGETNKWCGNLPLLQVIKNSGQNLEECYQLLSEWNALDPVSDIEMRRNDYVETIQGNRNPFVDYPSLVDRMFSLYL